MKVAVAARRTRIGKIFMILHAAALIAVVATTFSGTTIMEISAVSSSSSASSWRPFLSSMKPSALLEKHREKKWKKQSFPILHGDPQFIASVARGGGASLGGGSSGGGSGWSPDDGSNDNSNSIGYANDLVVPPNISVEARGGSTTTKSIPTTTTKTVKPLSPSSDNTAAAVSTDSAPVLREEPVYVVENVSSAKSEKSELEMKPKLSKKSTREISLIGGGGGSDAAVGKSTKQLLKEERKEIKKKIKEEKKLHKQYAKSLKSRNATNKRRKFMHFAWGMLFATLNNVVPRSRFLPCMSVLTGATCFMEVMRYKEGFAWMNRALHFVLGKALRKSEMEGKFTGSLYYFAGVTATSYLYPKPCATLGIIQLAIADPTASYFGRATRNVYWSRINNGFCWGLGRNKGILGFLGGAISCVPMNYRILSLATSKLATEITKRTVFMASLALGLAGAFADLIVPTPALTMPKTLLGGRIKHVPPFHVDDNFIVPIVSGFACTYILRLAGVPIDLPLTKNLFV